MTTYDGAIGDARKRRLPEIEMDPSTLRGQAEWAQEVAESARVRAASAEKERDELGKRVTELEHALVTQADKFNAIIEDLRYRNAELQADRNECKALHKLAEFNEQGQGWIADSGDPE